MPPRVLDALGRALQLDEAERDYLYVLARSAEPGTRRRSLPTSVRPAIQLIELVGELSTQSEVFRKRWAPSGGETSGH